MALYRHRTMPPLIINEPNPKLKEFKETMAMFTANCILDCPGDIVEYAAIYFEDLLDNPNLFNPIEVSRRGVVYGTSFNPKSDMGKGSILVLREIDEEQFQLLNKSLNNNVLFKSLDLDERKKVFACMTTRDTKRDEVIIQQGEEGNHFFIIESGTFEAYVEAEGINRLIKVYKEEGSFGELALMYDQPRAATIISKDYGRLWVVERNVFRKIVLRAGFEKRKTYEEYFSRVPVLEPLTNYERQLLADATITMFYEDGDVIIAERDVAHGMYFIEKGQVKVAIHNMQLNVLGPGEYFGEVALLMKSPRFASVTAIGKVKLAYISVEAFESLLGSCVEIMKRNLSSYKAQIKQIFGSQTSVYSDLRGV